MVTWLRRLLLVAVLAAAAWYLVTRWHQVWHTLSAVSPVAAVAGQVAVLAAMATATYGWLVLVNEFGPPVGAVAGGRIYLVGQLGKYLPGSVWAYLLQMELGRQAGVARARVFTASLVQLGVSLVAALALGAAIWPWLLAALPLGLAALHPAVLTWSTSRVLRLLRRPPLEHRLRWSTVARVAGSAVATYLLYGVHLWLLSGAQLLLCTGAIAVGLNAGLLLFLLPSGAGLRDVVVAAVLATTLGPTRAAAFAVLSRLMFTVGDLASAGIAAGLARYQRPASGRTVRSQGTPTSCTPRST
ncbi:MAG TPA: UPF0104 family protein [Pseudonocardiaceae bacterium]|nr:UPF0104 family protein [Pseudonocardiaceae bacterium]